MNYKQKVDWNQKVYVVNFGEIEELTLAEHVMKSAEETTSPRGVENKLHIRENEETGKFEVWTWGILGRYPSKHDEFDTQEEADEYILEFVYERNFLNDDQRNTHYHFTLEEAKEELIQNYADNNGVSYIVAESILHHQEIAKLIGEEKEEAIRLERKREKERIDELAMIYASKLNKIDGEKYKETASRLSNAIGSKIETKVFHQAVRLIRSKNL